VQVSAPAERDCARADASERERELPQMLSVKPLQDGPFVVQCHGHKGVPFHSIVRDHTPFGAAL
jgi:hypothetical protein